MSMFLKLLLYKLKTFNGVRDSASKLIRIIKEQRMSHLKMGRSQSLNLISILNVEKEASHLVMIKSITRYNILRFKMKLSYSAFVRNVIFKELLLA